MQRVREILLHEYIGAITIALVLARAAGIAIGIIMRPINFFLENHNRPHGVFNPAGTEFPWNSLVAPGLSLVLYLGLALGLLYWLYLKQTPATPPASEDEPAADTAAGANQA